MRTKYWPLEFTQRDITFVYNNNKNNNNKNNNKNKNPHPKNNYKGI